MASLKKMPLTGSLLLRLASASDASLAGYGALSRGVAAAWYPIFAMGMEMFLD